MQTQLGRKTWVQPIILERRSVSHAQASKILNVTELTVIVNGISVVKGPAS